VRFLNTLRARGDANANKSGIALPVSTGFQPEVWTAAYEAISEGCPRDAAAHEAGLLIFSKLRQVGAELMSLSAHAARLSPEENARWVLHHLNFAMAQLLKALPGPGPDGLVSLEHILTDRPVGRAHGAGYTVLEAVEALTEAARFPLRFALSNKPLGTHVPQAPLIGADTAVLNSLRLAQMYGAYERLWQGVQWSDASPSRHGRVYGFNETASDHSLEVQLDLFRRSRRFAHDIAERTAKAPKPPVPFEVVPVVVPEGLAAVRMSNLDEEQLDTVREALGAIDVTLAYELRPFLSVNHPKLGLPLGDVLVVWQLLSCIAKQSLRIAWRREEEIVSTENLSGKPHLSGVFERSSLVQVLAASTRRSKAQIESVLERLTFSKGRERGRYDELWDRPLVPIGDSLGLAWNPLTSGDTTRLVATLATEEKDLFVEHAQRGHVFEDLVVAVLHHALETSPTDLKASATLFQARIQPDDPVGDIDCILIVDETAFVLECRVVRNAATPYEHWDVIQTLLGDKAPQVMRKVDYLRKDSNRLKELMAKAGVTLAIEVRRYVGVVVSNSYLFEGRRRVEPYFVHVDTLLNSILDGGPKFGDVVHGEEMEYQVAYFESEVPPADALLSSIANPAKAEMYTRCLQQAVFDMPVFDEGDTPVQWAQWTLSMPPLGKLLELLSQCSFKAMLRSRTVQAAR
jgi:hypothetical protein